MPVSTECAAALLSFRYPSLFLYYESFLEKLDSLGLKYYLLGDLNCNLASLQYDSNTRR